MHRQNKCSCYYYIKNLNAITNDFPIMNNPIS